MKPLAILLKIFIPIADISLSSSVVVTFALVVGCYPISMILDFLFPFGI